MKNIFLFYSLIICLLMQGSVFASTYENDQYQFNHPAQAKLFYDLIQETRCVVCQSQSIADSNAPLATDLRHKIYNLVMENKDKQDIHAFLVKRYGNFILLDPPFNAETLMLWFLPGLILLLAMVYFSLTYLRPKR